MFDLVQHIRVREDYANDNNAIIDLSGFQWWLS